MKERIENQRSQNTIVTRKSKSYSEDEPNRTMRRQNQQYVSCQIYMIRSNAMDLFKNVNRSNVRRGKEQLYTNINDINAIKYFEMFYK